MSSRQEANQTILPNGQINISLLKREISSELQSNDRSIAQEYMKKKAIHSSTDYTEFENFVAASELKPVSSAEMGQLFASRQTSIESTTSSKSVKNRFNKLSGNEMDILNFYELGKHGNSRNPNNNNNNKATLKDVETDFSKLCMQEVVTNKKLTLNKSNSFKKMTKKAKRKSRHSVPRNATEFEKELRIFDNETDDAPQLIMTYLLLPESAIVGNSSELLSLVQKESINSDTFHRLLTGGHKLRIPSEKLIEMHKLEMNHTTLQRIIKALHYLTSHEHWQSEDIFATVYSWTNALTQCGRFVLNLQFLDEEHSIFFDEIVSYLASRVGDHEHVRKLLSMIPSTTSTSMR